MGFYIKADAFSSQPSVENKNNPSAFLRKKMAVVVRPSEHQTGEPKKKENRSQPALAAGKRISKNGNVYYEYRRNRSDVNGRLTGR